MCTAATYLTGNFYFGRTLDNGFSYGEEIAVTPRKFPFHFINKGIMKEHYAMIGMAHISKNYPLYYEAMNEKGLGMAGLNFVGNAVYKENVPDRDNIAQFEFIPWILGQCDSVREARVLLKNMNLTGVPFDEKLPPAQLHWMITDKNEAVTVEVVEAGIRIYDNPVGILTNNPPFARQMFQLNNYMHLSVKNPENHFSKNLPLETYSLGMGALGLPGDLSSQSRFVRAAFVRMNSVSGDSELESVSQFFHILGAVDQQRGCCAAENGMFETTIYTSCYNADKGICYYTTYDNHQITAVNMYHENLMGGCLVRYPLICGEQIKRQN